VNRYQNSQALSDCGDYNFSGGKEVVGKVLSRSLVAIVDRSVAACICDSKRARSCERRFAIAFALVRERSRLPVVPIFGQFPTF